MPPSLRRIGLAASVLLASGCASAAITAPPGRLLLDAPTVTIPLTEEGDNLYSVEVFLEGAGPYRFLLDSGAGVTVLDPVVAERFLAAGEGLPFRLRGALGGEPRAVPRGALAEVSFRPAGGPGARVHDVPFVAHEVPHSFDGVAGMGLFRGCRVVLDFPRSVIEAALPGPSFDDVPIGDGSPPVVTLRLGEASVVAVLDTGFTGVLYIPPEIAAGVPALGPPAGLVFLADVHGSRAAVERRLQGELRLGSGGATDPWVFVGEGGAILGAGFLRAWRVTLDGRGRFVDLESPLDPRRAP